MSDLANLVLAGLRDKVVEDLKQENEQLSTRNTALSKSMLLEAPSFGRVEDSAGAVLARSQQFPDQPKCDCCSWFPLQPNPPLESVPLKQFADIKVYLGGTAPESQLAESKEITLQQVTQYCIQTNRVGIQFTDSSLGFTLHVNVGPISKEVGKAVFAKTPRDIRLFCDKIIAVAPEATVHLICLSIINEKALPLLITKGQLTKEEARGFLRIPDDIDDDIESSEEENGSGDEAKGP